MTNKTVNEIFKKVKRNRALDNKTRHENRQKKQVSTTEDVNKLSLANGKEKERRSTRNCCKSTNPKNCNTIKTISRVSSKRKNPPKKRRCIISKRKSLSPVKISKKSSKRTSKNCDQTSCDAKQQSIISKRKSLSPVKISKKSSKRTSKNCDQTSCDAKQQSIISKRKSLSPVKISKKSSNRTSKNCDQTSCYAKQQSIISKRKSSSAVEITTVSSSKTCDKDGDTNISVRRLSHVTPSSKHKNIRKFHPKKTVKLRRKSSIEDYKKYLSTIPIDVLSLSRKDDADQITTVSSSKTCDKEGDTNISVRRLSHVTPSSKHKNIRKFDPKKTVKLRRKSSVEDYKKYHSTIPIDVLSLSRKDNADLYYADGLKEVFHNITIEKSEEMNYKEDPDYEDDLYDTKQFEKFRELLKYADSDFEGEPIFKLDVKREDPVEDSVSRFLYSLKQSKRESKRRDYTHHYRQRRKKTAEGGVSTRRRKRSTSGLSTSGSVQQSCTIVYDSLLIPTPDTTDDDENDHDSYFSDV